MQPGWYDPVNGYDLERGLESVGKGWERLVREAFDNIPEGYRITQVKEKFGGLRIYFDPINSGNDVPYSEVALGFQDLLDEIENESYTICENDGKSGAVLDTSRFWMKSLCPECIEKRRQD